MRTIAFIPGSFRPFGDHHFRMIKHYSDICDGVEIIVSEQNTSDSARPMSNGHSLNGKDACAIINMCIADSGMKNVTICGCDQNPVKGMLDRIANLTDCNVIIGCGSKDGDQERFKWLNPEYFANRNVHILPIDQNAFSLPQGYNGFRSSSEIRNHIDDRNMVRTYLPTCITGNTFDAIMDILGGADSDERIYESMIEDRYYDGDDKLDINEFDVDDQFIDGGNCLMNAYGAGCDDCNSDKAFDFTCCNGDNNIEIFLDPNDMEWDSLVNGKTRLTPDQMNQFFHTGMFNSIGSRLHELWAPGSKYGDLSEAVDSRKIRLMTPDENLDEDSNVFRRGNVDRGKSREKNAAGEQTRTRSGRKYITPSNFDVRHDENEAYYVWPSKGMEFKWSQWSNWKNIRPLARMRWRLGQFVYGISISPFLDDDENRGFRSYNLDLQPPLQYLTPEETQEMMDLTIVQKFLRHAIKRIHRYIDIPDDELLRRINRPDKCTIDDIRKTKHAVKNTLKALKDRRADTYIYT